MADDRHGRARVTLVWLALVALGAAACEDPARPVPPASGGNIWVESDPPGGEILVGGEPTGLVTPDTVTDVEVGAHLVEVVLDTAGLIYRLRSPAFVQADTQAVVRGPLTIACTSLDCASDAAVFHSPGNARFVVNGGGPLFFYESGDQGIVWPGQTQNSYAAAGTPLIAARVEERPVALGAYNYGHTLNMWAGRPTQRSQQTDSGFVVRQTAWIAPSRDPSEPTLRGIAVDEEVFVPEGLPNAIIVRVTFRNISTDSVYRLLDAAVPQSGLTLADSYLGFIIDADVGAFTEGNDDLVSYDAGRRLVYTYDGDFSVAGFGGGWSARPALIGLMLLEAPDAASRVALSAWPFTVDWRAGSGSTGGYGIVTGSPTGLEDHPDPRIGFAPDSLQSNYLMSVAGGPVTLEPGEQASALVAVLIAPPVNGAFSTGAELPAGDPADAERDAAAVAQHLFELADSVAALYTAPT